MSEPIQLPEMPNPAPTIEVFPGIHATLMSDFKRFSTGNLNMDIARVKVSRGDEVVGSINSGVQGIWTIEVGSALYSVPMEDIFNAYYDAHNKAMKGAVELVVKEKLCTTS